MSHSGRRACTQHLEKSPLHTAMIEEHQCPTQLERNQQVFCCNTTGATGHNDRGDPTQTGEASPTTNRQETTKTSNIERKPQPQTEKTSVKQLKRSSSQVERSNHAKICEERLLPKKNRGPCRGPHHNLRGGTTATREELRVHCLNSRGGLCHYSREASGHNERGCPPDITPREESLCDKYRRTSHHKKGGPCRLQ